MCGIVGYIGNKNAVEIILNGLELLEYRGYDSSGIAVLENEKIKYVKSVGRIQNLREKIEGSHIETANVGIGHTRWATHGVPSDVNSHPHISNSGKFAVVHNGIIENYLHLKEELTEKGVEFVSETDTEAVAQLLEFVDNGDFLETVFKVREGLRGSYALGILKEGTNELIGTRLESPLVVGVGDKEFYIASDVTAVLNHTKDFIYLENGDLIHFKDGYYTIYDENNQVVEREIKTVDWSFEAATKEGFPHFMLKEIYEQPKAIRQTLLSRLDENDELHLDGLEDLTKEELQKFNKCYIVACGTAYHAGLVGKEILESVLKFPVIVDIASEFRYSDRLVDDKTLVIIVSQSGETADTLAALREAKKQSAKVISITNVVGSSIARESHNAFYTWAGTEIAVASTKGYTTQLISFYIMALKFGRLLGTVSKEYYDLIISEMKNLPEKVEELLENLEPYKEVAEILKDKKTCFYLGRGLDYYTAMESALKLKELSYIYTESFAAGELKHGTIALIEEGIPVLVVATQDKLYEKIVSNIKEVKARGASVIEISQIDNGLNVSDIKIRIPETLEILMPVISVVSTQLISYYTSLAKGNDVDKPRNLAKSVTVE